MEIIKKVEQTNHSGPTEWCKADDRPIAPNPIEVDAEGNPIPPVPISHRTPIPTPSEYRRKCHQSMVGTSASVPLDDAGDDDPSLRHYCQTRFDEMGHDITTIRSDVTTIKDQLAQLLLRLLPPPPPKGEDAFDLNTDDYLS